MAGNSSFLRCEVVGADDLRRVLTQIGEDLRKRTVQAALRDALQPVADEARSLAPTGRDDTERAVALLVVGNLKGKPRKLRKLALKGRALRDTIVVTSQLSQNQRRRGGRPGSEFEAFVSATAPHAHLVEFGTSTRRARPFLRLAFRQTRDLARGIIVAVINREVALLAAAGPARAA